VPHEQHHVVVTPSREIEGGLERCPHDIQALPLFKELHDATSRHGCPLATLRRLEP
jgi:hypothetical protein